MQPKAKLRSVAARGGERTAAWICGSTTGEAPAIRSSGRKRDRLDDRFVIPTPRTVTSPLLFQVLIRRWLAISPSVTNCRRCSSLGRASRSAGRAGPGAIRLASLINENLWRPFSTRVVGRRHDHLPPCINDRARRHFRWRSAKRAGGDGCSQHFLPAFNSLFSAACRPRTSQATLFETCGEA